MANTYLTSDLLAKEACAQVVAASTFLMTGNKKYEGLYTQQAFTKGDTINMPLDNRYKVQRGDSVTASDIVDRKISMTIGDVYTQAISVKPTDYQRNIRDFGPMFLAPAAHSIAADMNNDISAGAITSAYIHNGVPGSAVSSYATLRNARADMLKFDMPKRQRWMAALSLDDSATLQNSLANQFNTGINTPILNDASLGGLAGFDIFEDQAIQKHVGYTGDIGTPIVGVVIPDTATTFAIAGLTGSITGIIKKDTLLTFDDAWAVDPVRHQAIAKKFQVRVTADVDSAADGTATVPFVVSPSNPALNTDPTSPFQNAVGIAVANSIAAGTPITVSQNYNANICYTDMALYCAMPRMEAFGWAKSSVYTDPNSGVSVRVSIESDVMNNKDYIRMDCQLAFAWNPEQMLILMS